MPQVTHRIRSEHLAEQFESLEQQKMTAKQGIWLFLATELLFFSPMLLAYVVYTITYPKAFIEGSHSLDLFFGTLNTGILLTSSLTMTLAIHYARQGKGRLTTVFLYSTAILGCAFLWVKGLEYRSDILKNVVPGVTMDAKGHHLKPTHIFILIYFCLTGLHALHLTVGVVITFIMAIRSSRSEFTREYHNPVEVTSLYWHFVDSVWALLYPLLYLLGRGWDL